MRSQKRSAANITEGRVSKRRKSARRYSLSQLMAQFKPSHPHGEWDLGRPVGKEPW